jgi:hypothetical protein
MTTVTAFGDDVRRCDRASHVPPPTVAAATATADHANVRRVTGPGASGTVPTNGSGSPATEAATDAETGGTSRTTSPTNLYPCFGKVSINFGSEALSFNTERICRTQKFKLWSRSTFTPFPISAVPLRSQPPLRVPTTDTLQADIRRAVQQNASSEQLGTLWLTLANRYQDRFELEKAEDAYARAIHLLRDTASQSQYAESLQGIGMCTAHLAGSERRGSA